MHEVGLCEGVVHAVEQRAGGRPVAALGVRVGVLHRVAPEAFRQAFSMVSPGTVAHGAEVEITAVPIQATCSDCGEDFTAAEPWAVCPVCSSVQVATEGGNELTLVWLRYRDGAEADRSPADHTAAGQPRPRRGR